MDLSLEGRVVAVTGAARGIGRAIASRFAGEGARVVALDVDEDALNSLRSDPPSSSFPEIDAHVLDVTNSHQVDAVLKKITREHERIDVLINNAGIEGNGYLTELTDEAWDRCFDVNVKGVFNTCRAVAPMMMDQRYGRILNAASFAAIVPIVGSSAYAAAKSAVVQFSRTIAGELGPWGITVNSYAPGMIPTQLNHFRARPRAEQERLLDTLTIRRWGSEEEVADLLVFLASSRAQYITGTLVDISGGKLATQIPRLAYDSMPAMPAARTSH